MLRVRLIGRLRQYRTRWTMRPHAMVRFLSDAPGRPARNSEKLSNCSRQTGPVALDDRPGPETASPASGRAAYGYGMYLPQIEAC